MTVFALVHGGCHGAWCWERLAPHLDARGHDAGGIARSLHRRLTTALSDAHVTVGEGRPYPGIPGLRRALQESTDQYLSTHFLRRMQSHLESEVGTVIDFFRDQINRRVKVGLDVLGEQIRSRQRHSHGTGKLALGRSGLVALQRHAPRTIVDVDVLAAELEGVRSRGYATTLDELEPGLWAVAAPIVDGRDVIAAVSISGPTTRLRDGLLGELGRLLVDEMRSISIRMGTNDAKRGAA